jgi:glyoxylase-like metal-dependent hydrolase (beta-lactamase superfamily II)
MILHPQCACSRAAVGELALLMSQAEGRADTHALFFRPAGVAKEWVENDLWRDVSAIPGVQVRIDDQGKEARLFHAATSGSVLLYDRDGRLIFEGGITPSRAHSGDNAGRSAIVALLNGGRPERNRTFVFGCSLLDSRTLAGDSK